MKLKNFLLWCALFAGITSLVYACTHKDVISPSSGAKIERGNDQFTLGVDKWKHDKSHSNVLWETQYLGSVALLTGRFNMFGISSVSFHESNPELIAFEGWVRLNTVNTGEPGRDGSCLLGTFGTATGKVDEPENLAKIKTKKVELSKSDKGYIVTFDLTFLGKTKEQTGKLMYVKKTNIPASGTAAAYDALGMKFDFQFLCKTDYSLVSSNIGDKVGVTLNMNFNNK